MKEYAKTDTIDVRDHSGARKSWELEAFKRLVEVGAAYKLAEMTWGIEKGRDFDWENVADKCQAKRGVMGLMSKSVTKRLCKYAYNYMARYKGGSIIGAEDTD